MSQHIEWADAPRALFADASWVEQNADNGNDAGDVALVFDTGSGAIAFSGTPDELRRTVRSMTARLDTFAPVETGRAGGADEDLAPALAAIADAVIVRQHGEQFAGGEHDNSWIRFVRVAAIEAAKAGHALTTEPIDDTSGEVTNIADLDGTVDAADWVTTGHVLDEYEVAFIRSLVIPGSVTTRG